MGSEMCIRDRANGSVCGERQDVESRMAARGVIVSRSTGDAVARVEVVPTEDALEGTLLLSRTTGTTTRIVSATTCDEVLDALAFTLALALEGEAASAGAEPAPTPPSAPSLVRAIPNHATERPRVAVLDLGAGAGAGILRAVSPGIGASVGGWLIIGARGPTWWSPTAVLGFAFGLPVAEQEGSIRATSALQIVTVDACPARLGNRNLAFRPCARGMFGRSQVRSEGFVGARLDERLFASVGVAARGEAKIAGPLWCHLDFAITLPLERATYFVGNSSTFETPPVAISTSAGLGVHFL